MNEANQKVLYRVAYALAPFEPAGPETIRSGTRYRIDFDLQHRKVIPGLLSVDSLDGNHLPMPDYAR